MEFKGSFWITVYQTMTPLLRDRLKEAGCVVYQGDISFFNRVYALFEDEDKMNWINKRHHRSVRMVLGTYTGKQKWMEDGHHKRIEL